MNAATATGALMSDQPNTKGGAPKRSFIPWIYVIGMLVVVAVNMVMITFAITTFRGLAVEKPYEKGVEFNRALARADARAKLGWQMDASLGRSSIVLDLRDASGAPITGAEVEIRLSRPVEAVKIGPLALAMTGAGRYAADIELPGLGQWDMAVAALKGDDRFETTIRTVAK